MLKGRNQAILLSLFVHIFIFYLMSQTVIVPPIVNEIKPEAIKSFIYTPPKPEEKAVIKTIDKPVESNLDDHVKKHVDKKSRSETKPLVVEESTKALNEIVPQETTKITKVAQPKETGQTNRSFSAYDQLKILQKNLNKQIIEQESMQYGRHKSASVLDGIPDLVPHSRKQLTVDEIKRKTSKQISSDIQITKGDDGRCSIERDLSVVGMAGVKSVEGFNCGKSKFDKSFDEHMKKVLTKLGK